MKHHCPWCWRMTTSPQRFCEACRTYWQQRPGDMSGKISHVKALYDVPGANLLACCGTWVPITSMPFESPCCHRTYFLTAEEVP